MKSLTILQAGTHDLAVLQTDDRLADELFSTGVMNMCVQRPVPLALSMA